MTAEIIWQTPPVRTGRGRAPGAAAAFVAALKERPGEWAIYPNSDNSAMATTLKRRYGVETTVRKQPDGKFNIYVRWNGAAS